MTNLLELARDNIKAFKNSAAGNAEPLRDSFALAEADPNLIAQKFYSYYKAIRDLLNLTPEEISTIKEVNHKLCSRRGADEFLDALGDQKETILKHLRQMGNLVNAQNQDGIDMLSKMMNNAWTIKQTEPDWTPKDGDPRADNVIWGFVRGAINPETDIDFALCHGIERTLSVYLPESEYTHHKDWLLCALNDVIAMRGLQGNSNEAKLLSIWRQPRPDGLGWISPRRLEAYINVIFKTQTDFGRGKFMGNNPGILLLTPEQRLQVSAWRHACPRPGEVSREYGLEWTRQRYDECDFVFSSLIIKQAKDKPGLYQLLTSSVPRLPNEPMGYHEADIVPESHQTEMSPLSTPWGYALPRVFIEIAGRGQERSPDKYLKALDMLNEAVQKSNTPVELLANLSETAIKSGVTAEKILGHIFAPGILEEENCITMFNQIADSTRQYAPTLWEYYSKLPIAQRKKLGLIPQFPLE